MDKVLMFALGAAAGSLLTWKLIEKKYKDLADEEIASVVERFREKSEKRDDSCIDKYYHDDADVVFDKIKEKDGTEYLVVKDSEYAYKLEELGYIDEPNIEEGEEDDLIAPYVISPEEFGEKEGYGTTSWTYYADSILTDEDGEIVTDPELIIGDGLSHFGEYEDDSVCVRNENEHCDFEILKHSKTHSEIYGEAN